MRTKLYYATLFIFCVAGEMHAQVHPVTIEADKNVASVSPAMWGIFFEDINFAADGGVYAEMVKNRSFEFSSPFMGWRRIISRNGTGRIELLNSGNENNPRFVHLISTSTDSVVGLQNDGFRGMGVRKGDAYNFSVRAKNIGPGALTLDISLLDSTGNVIGTTSIRGITGDWSTYRGSFSSNATDKKASLRIIAKGKASVQLDMISLFPDKTWKGRSNGLRADLVQLLADLKPGFVRFPGGCIVEGRDLSNRYQWKKTVGNVEDRKVIINRWSSEMPRRSAPDYYQSYGLGFYEYFLLSEDIGAEPLPILNCGMACQFNTSELALEEDLETYIQDAFDLIEFANGDVTTKWGKLRADMGHPEPFNLKKIGVGNEQWGPEYVTRAKLFLTALRERHPEIEIIGSVGPYSGGDGFVQLWKEMRQMKVDYVDEHYYSPPNWFLRNAKRYDRYDTVGPKVFAGEFAAHDNPDAFGRRRNNWYSALTEAAFMTGLERNAKLVTMASYAPLFAHVDAWQWSPNLIWFDNLISFGTPNYHVQKLFSTNKGTHVLPVLQNMKVVAGEDSLYASATYDSVTNEIIIKLVNANAVQKVIPFSIAGKGKLAKKATVTTLSSEELQSENSIAEPGLIVPINHEQNITGKEFTFTAAPRSMNVIRLKRVK